MAAPPEDKNFVGYFSASAIQEGLANHEKTIIDRAMDGTVSSADFRSFVLDYIKQQNTGNLHTIECSLSKNSLDFNVEGPYPVVDLTDKNAPFITDKVTIFNNSTKKDIYFNIHVKENPKFYLEIDPPTGKIKKNSSVDIQFRMRCFCTTKLYQMIKICFTKNKPKQGTLRLIKKGKETKPKHEKSPSQHNHDEELGHLFVSFKIESELSNMIDYDEIKIGDILGRGGYGTVHKGSWRDTEVAIKILNTSEFVEEERELVRREIKLMSRMAHPNIVTFLGSTHIPGQPLVIVMEYVPGGSLTKLLEKPLSNRFKCKLALDVCKGLQHLHSHNIYHRDIKPDNLLVVSSSEDAFQNLKLTDFGTSKAATKAAHKDREQAASADADNNNASPSNALTKQPSNGGPSSSALSSKNSSPNTTSRGISTTSQRGLHDDGDRSTTTRRHSKGVGTLIYQAPEILDGKADYAIDKTDIFSFGVLLWQVFSGKEPYSEPPYNKTLRTRWDIEKFVIGGNRLEMPPNCPPRIQSLIKRCWAANPQDRPPLNIIIRELQGAIEEFEKEEREKKEKSTPKIEVPRGNLNLIGWCGDMSRNEADQKLRNVPWGTFLIRWSHNTSSYVLSHTNKQGQVLHIAFIKPGPNGTITVDKEDGQKVRYDSIFDYVKAMKESNIITEPISLSEDLYDRTPSMDNYQKAPDVIRG